MSDTLRLRAGETKEVEGTVEVVHADAWDDLCGTATEAAEALRALHNRALKFDPSYSGSDDEERAWQALRRYDDA